MTVCCIATYCTCLLVTHQVKVQGGLSPRPLLSVPHILADESSCYYHGYVLAEMSVHQTRDHFTSTLGTIVDNSQVCGLLLCAN